MEKIKKIGRTIESKYDSIEFKTHRCYNVEHYRKYEATNPTISVCIGVKNVESFFSFEICETNTVIEIGHFSRIRDSVAGAHMEIMIDALISTIELIAKEFKHKTTILSDSNREDRVRSCVFDKLKNKFGKSITSFVAKDRSGRYDIELLNINIK